mgnify:CR=1 FL=1
MRQYRAMIRYCFPSINIDEIKSTIEFANLANEAEWLMENYLSPKPLQQSGINVG